MNYILSPFIALRSWDKVPFAYYVKNDIKAYPLTKEEFLLLLKCDGKTDLEESTLIKNLLDRGLVIPAKADDSLSEWQKPQVYFNRYMPRINLEITAKCNYNCVHCFNAIDNSPLLSEMPYEKVLTLLDEAKEVGVCAFTITGGEPMVHKNFMDIIRAIYDRNMSVFELNTNGYFINEAKLAYFNLIGCKPLIKISFDGLGYHDWMRGRKGAEEITLNAIKLCIEKGFSVKIQYNINKKNLPSLYETLDLLDSMGVEEIRLICTTPAPRWEKNAAGQTLSLKEYFDLSLEITKNYISKEHHAVLNIWQVLTIFPNEKMYALNPVKSTETKYRETIPICSDARSMMAIGATGNVYPCMQMSGYFDEHNIYLGNVFKDGLTKLLDRSKYMSYICQDVKDRINANDKCGQCKYLEYCAGGCPALGLLYSKRGNILDPDPSKCLFYEYGYYEKMTKLFTGWHNLTIMDNV